ncbi:hypothetical protein [Actinomyces qiguomingii]|uniref:hypothetical protein n=1 Tax=Actinomyces qiguomingii TaxID=2057800 RepID=UPI00143D7A04|nr:hypothetical protein [Actinomyces qiguomingii]
MSRELRGAGQVLPLDLNQLRYLATHEREWVQDETILDVAVGGSSAALFSARIKVTT